MNIKEIDQHIREFLKSDLYQDYGINGIQVENEGEISKILFAVDLSMELIKYAIKIKANLIVVHHGIFWGQELPIKGAHYKRLKELLTNNIGLLAYHLPLDGNIEIGNNSLILQQLGIAPDKISNFCSYKGMPVGYMGQLEAPMGMDEIVSRLGLDSSIVSSACGTKDKFTSIAAVSGSAARYADDAVRMGLDLFITGEASHSAYYNAIENGLSILFGGHYQTETFGIKALSHKISTDLKIESIYKDIPVKI